MSVIICGTCLNGKEDFLRIWDQVASRINPETKEKIDKLKRQEDKLRSLLGEMIMVVHAHEVWKVEHKDIKKKYGQWGKPFLEGWPDKKFNISHSGNFVLAVFDNEEVGVDIEYIRLKEIDFLLDYFAISEAEEARLKTPAQRKVYLYKLWTLKESYLKAKGTGIRRDLNKIAFNIESSLKIELLDLLDPNQNALWNFKLYDDLAGYSISVCSKKKSFPSNILMAESKELVEKFLSASS